MNKNIDFYLAMPFKELADQIFSYGGDLRPCPKTAKKALILRLEKRFKTDGFGCMTSGELHVFDAYVAAALILTHGWDA